MVETLSIPIKALRKEEVFTKLYKENFPAVARHVSKMGGSLEEAKDVFHDALIIYYEKSQEKKLDMVENENAYIVGISKHLWNKKFKDNQRHSAIEKLTEDSHTSENSDTVLQGKVLQFLERAGKKCMEILQAFYYEKLSAEEIADRFNYSGVRSATVQKFKCLEKVREEVKNRSMNYGDFLE